MASLIKRSNGIYYSIAYINGRRVWKSTGTSSRSTALLLLERNEVEASKKPEVIILEQFRTPLFKYLNYIENTDSFRTKTLKSRVIPMDELTHLALSKKKRASEYVLTFPDEHPLSEGRVSLLFKLHCRKAGIRQEIHFRSFRHTEATWLVQNNVSLFNVQRLLGHSKIEVTEMSSHLEVGHLRKPLETLATFLK